MRIAQYTVNVCANLGELAPNLSVLLIDWYIQMIRKKNLFRKKEQCSLCLVAFETGRWWFCKTSLFSRKLLLLIHGNSAKISKFDGLNACLSSSRSRQMWHFQVLETYAQFSKSSYRWASIFDRNNWQTYFRTQR